MHRDGRGFVYELLYDGQGKDGRPFVPGLIDVEALEHAYDAERSGVKGERSGSGRPSVGVRTGVGRGGEIAPSARAESASSESRAKTSKTHIKGNGGADGPVLPLAAAASSVD